jgi:serine/threonine-protein kinase
VILYEALSGRTPYEAETFPELLVKMHTTSPTPLREVVPAIDPELAAIIHGALSVKPADRPPSAEALLRALAPFAEGKRVRHLDTLRGEPLRKRQSPLLGTANTMIGDLADDARVDPAPLADASEPSATSEGRAGKRAAPGSEIEEPSPAVGPATREVISHVVPRRPWIPWAILAAVVVLVAGGALALAVGPTEVAAPTLQPHQERSPDGAEAAAQAEPGPIAEGVEPPAPAPPAREPAAPAAPPARTPAPREEVATPTPPPDPPPPVAAPRNRPTASERGGSPERYDIARDNPY